MYRLLSGWLFLNVRLELNSPNQIFITHWNRKFLKWPPTSSGRVKDTYARAISYINKDRDPHPTFHPPANDYSRSCEWKQKNGEARYRFTINERSKQVLCTSTNETLNHVSNNIKWFYSEALHGWVCRWHLQRFCHISLIAQHFLVQTLLISTSGHLAGKTLPIHTSGHVAGNTNWLIRNYSSDSLYPARSGPEMTFSILTVIVNKDQQPEIINVRHFCHLTPRYFIWLFFFILFCRVGAA